MRCLYFDCGTTNMRGYDLRDGRICAAESLTAGSRDSSRAGSPQPMLQALSELYARLLTAEDPPPDGIYLSGMAGSKYGLLDVAHLELPVTREKLREGIAYFYDETVFHHRVGIIPGLRTPVKGTLTFFEQVARVHNLRGEETEAFGVLRAMGDPSGKVTLILPGSHTQVLFFENGEIRDLLSLITGELFSAIRSGTVLSGSVSDIGEMDARGREMVSVGYRSLLREGFNRALYILHASNLFGEQSGRDRACALNGIVEGSAVNAILSRVDFSDPGRIVVAGGRKLCEIYKTVFDAAEAERGAFPFAVETVAADQGMPFSVLGFLSLTE